MVLVSSFVSLLLFCLVVLSIIERGLLKSSTIIVHFSISFSVLTIFALHVLQLCCLVYTHFIVYKIANLGGLILISYNVPPCFW